ncbi:MAG: hypothetical protein ABIR96_05260, partial [Bdellovibrionota bacterium]
HHYGRLAQETQDYAVMIDGLLGPILEVLQDAATHGRQIGAVMTSDHGMSDLRYLAKIDKALYDLAPGALLINQGRLMGINFAPAFSDRQRADALNAATRLGGVGLTVGKTRDGLTIYTQTTTHTIRYATSDCGRDGAYALSINNGTFYCPSELNKISEQFFYPYFATNIAAYFRAKDAPDALVLASEETSFGDNLHAHHGGLTPDEIRVPLLFWNLEFKSAERLPQTFRLLEGFRQPSETSVKDR